MLISAVKQNDFFIKSLISSHIFVPFLPILCSFTLLLVAGPWFFFPREPLLPCRSPWVSPESAANQNIVFWSLWLVLWVGKWLNLVQWEGMPGLPQNHWERELLWAQVAIGENSVSNWKYWQPFFFFPVREETLPENIITLHTHTHTHTYTHTELNYSNS